MFLMQFLGRRELEDVKFFAGKVRCARSSGLSFLWVSCFRHVWSSDSEHDTSHFGAVAR